MQFVLCVCVHLCRLGSYWSWLCVAGDKCFSALRYLSTFLQAVKIRQVIFTEKTLNWLERGY